MKRSGRITILLLTAFVSVHWYASSQNLPSADENRFLVFKVDSKKQKVRFFWKDSSGMQFHNFQTLKDTLAKGHKKLVFATNGGMFKKDLSPQGLYIEDGLVKSPLDTVSKAYGNFYLQPNGIFYLVKDGSAKIRASSKFKSNTAISYATQSGPMLVIDGKLHPAFKNGSTNVNIRNGVGILPDGKLLFVQSKEKINFYDFASFFKEQGCQNALYLDGFVSRTYLPSQDWIQLDGKFGVIIGVVE